MEQEYTTSIGFRLLYGAISFIFFIFTLLIVIPAGNEKSGLDLSEIIIPGLAFIVMFFVFTNFYKRKVIVTDIAIKYSSVCGSKELLKKDIKGFKRTEKAIIIQPEDRSLSVLKIKDYISISRYKELLELLKKDLIDLNTAEYEINKQNLIDGKPWDMLQEDIELKFNWYKKIAVRYSLVSVLLFILSIYILNVSMILTIIMLMYPFAGIGLIVFSKGIVNLSAKRNSAHYPIFIALLFSGLALAIHSTRAVEIIDVNTIFQPIIIIALIIIIIPLLILVFKYRSDRIAVQLLCALGIAVVYSIGMVLSINSSFDFTKPNHIKARILTREYTAKKPTYEIVILTGNKNKFEFETIVKADPNETDLKGEIDISVSNGLLDIPWMYYQQ
jgi:hypothetical protein